MGEELINLARQCEAMTRKAFAVNEGLDELQRPDAGSCTVAVSVWFPRGSTDSVTVQLPPDPAVAVPTRVEPS